MSAAAELVARGTGTPPFDIMRAAYAVLHVSDIDASERFYVDLLGLLVSARTEDTLYLRGWEERIHHSLVLRRADVVGAERLGFRVRSNNDLDPIEAEFTRRGCVVRRVEGDHPGMGSAVRVWDPFGVPLEFFHEIVPLETQLQRFDLQRGAPVLRLDHFNLHSAQMEETFTFWQELGFRCTEYISTDGADERLTGAWLARKPTVHDLALTAGRGPRLHHLGFYVAEPGGVLRACDQLAAAGFAPAIERGPGRHGVSNAFFVYLRDPDGHRVELYSCDYYTGDPDLAPLRWSVSDLRCRSFWGAKAPDSWYDESSLLIGPDGRTMEPFAATVDERIARSDAMA